MKTPHHHLVAFLFLLCCCNYHTESLKSHELLLGNITIILDDLLKDYDSSQHPNLKMGTPTTIRTNIFIRSMGPISELEMTYSLDCYFRQYWRDPRLSFTGPVESLSLNIKMLEKLWRPDTFFVNGKHSHIHTITLPNKLLRINQQGDITYSMRLTIRAKCPMCLKSFPFDQQSCPLIIGSYAYNSKHIVYIWDEPRNESVSFVRGMTLSQFDLLHFPRKEVNLTRQEGNFSALQVNFFFIRHKGYFLIQVYIPCILIVILSWVSFWLNREATSDRVALGITAFLTLSTLSLDSRVDLPKVHYATALDTFLLMCFAYCMMTLLEFAGVHYFTKIGSGETIVDSDAEVEEEWVGSNKRTPDEEDSCPIMLNDGRSGGIVGFAWRNTIGSPAIVETPSKSMESKETQTEQKISYLRQFLHCIVADEQYRRERIQAAIREGSINSVSKIDTFSRIFFPVSFLFLNIGYWVMYGHFQESCDSVSGLS